MQVRNNIFHGQAGGSVIADAVSAFDHNLYHQVTGIPGTDPAPVQADPLFTAAGQGPAGFRLRCGSPALKAGTPVAEAGPRDYFGLPVPRVAPNIGIYQGRCLS
jgi:hypothetical protein